jgi:hypothetical protein
MTPFSGQVACNGLTREVRMRRGRYKNKPLPFCGVFSGQVGIALRASRTVARLSIVPYRRTDGSESHPYQKIFSVSATNNLPFLPIFCHVTA